MALNAGSLLTAVDFNTLKSHVNSEMERRKYTGSLSDYSTQVSVASGTKAMATHGKSVLDGIRAINPTDLPASPSVGSKILALETAANKLTDFASRPLVGENSGCAAVRLGCDPFPWPE